MVDYNRFYETGSAARELEIDYNLAANAEPKYEPVRRRSSNPKKDRNELRKRQMARRNQERALAMTPGYVVFLSVMIALTCAAAVLYIKLQTDANVYTDRIAVLQDEVELLRIDNDAHEKRINANTDVNALVAAAKNMGMDYPKADQVVYYSLDTSDYMTQYSSVK